MCLHVAHALIGRLGDQWIKRNSAQKRNAKFLSERFCVAIGIESLRFAAVRTDMVGAVFYEAQDRGLYDVTGHPG